MRSPVKLSQRYAATLKTVDGDVWHWDSQDKGFAIRQRNGAPPAWWVRYSVHSKKFKHHIGPCDLIKAEKAREKAREVIRSGRHGINHNEVERDARTGPTLTDLAVQHQESQKPPVISESWHKDKANNWRLHILPALGEVKVKDVSRDDVKKMLAKFAEQPALGNRVLATLSKALGDCETFRPPMRAQGTNPCYKVPRLSESKREQILSMDEVKAVVEKLNELAASELPHANVYDLFKVLLYSGRRLSEVSKRRWPDLNHNRRTLFVKKTKSGKELTARLSPEALEVVQSQPRVREWIFPNSLGTGPYMYPQNHWYNLCESIGVVNVRIHDIRHTVASYAAENGMSQRDIMELLGHSQMSTSERYMNVHDERKQSISDRASKAIANLAR